MIQTLQQNVPICPECKALMLTRTQNGSLFFACVDCKAIFKVIGKGKADIELVVTDKSETLMERDV